MANRKNHYEAAFEAWLRQRGVPYVAVDEAKRSVLAGGASLKSLDFLVAAPGERTYLVDVKGRRFPSGEEQAQYWKNWATEDDLVSLSRWEELFGEGFEALFVFAYDIVGDRAPLAEDLLFPYRDHLYGFIGIPLADYADRAHAISPRWETVAMGTGEFRSLARPMEEFLVA